MEKKEIETFCPASRQAWRLWLKKHHRSKQCIWLVYYKKNSGVSSLTYSDAVEEALCFGWIDSTRKSLDKDTFMQFFCQRKPTSMWSKINKEKVERLIAEGLMTKAGFDSIQAAQQNGSWILLDEAENLKVPVDLAREFKKLPGSKDFFLSLSKSARKMILQWLVLAKRPETRQKRITEIAESAAQQLKPKPFR